MGLHNHGGKASLDRGKRGVTICPLQSLCAELPTTGLRTVPNVLAATEGVAVEDPREEGDDEEVSINARNINRARASSKPTEKKRGCGRGTMGW